MKLYIAFGLVNNCFVISLQRVGPLMNVFNDIIYPAMDEFNLTLPKEKQLTKSPDTVLFGHGASIDSIQVVSLVIEVEELLQDEFDQNIKLVSEEAMSRQSTPFKTIASLAAYVEEIIGIHNA